MTDAIRTPDDLLAGLPDFPFEPSYRHFDGFRLAHVDAGAQIGRMIAGWLKRNVPAKR